MKKSTNSAVGIDVSSETLDVYLLEGDNNGVHQVFSNNEKGLKKCISFFKKNEFNGRIVMESTGRYHFLCAVMLREAGFSAFVINPLIVKKYHTANIRKCKTDKQDAKMLAQVALLEKNLIPFAKDRADLAIRQKISTLKSLEKTLQRVKSSFLNYRNTMEELGESMTETEDSIMATITTLDKQKNKLEKEITEIIKEKYDNNKFEILCSIPGVSPFLASLILFFFSSEEGTKTGKWVAFCGLEISTQQSGKWQGKGRLSKRGNKYLRKRLFAGGWGCFMNNEYFKKYYYELRENNRRGHVEALNIISRKIVRISFSLLKNNTFFDPARCF
ncbi:MAG: IS110 family transposase [Candidatus Peregrinibacteria bacterium]|nr:IS110 family transposase [Candidatus Peregrinibacteria bacterium]